MGLKVLDLFSGIGGFSLGLERAGMETVAFCEIEPFCQKVLAKHWPGVPIYDDITKLDGRQFAVDLVCGGFPCQPFSFAGKRKGEEDDRALWPELARILREAGPRWFIGENVPGLISLGLDQVLSDLEGLGYTTESFVIPACAVDAPHRRDRIWIIGNSNSNSKPIMPIDGKAQGLLVMGDSGCVGDELNRKRELSDGSAGEVQGKTQEQRVRVEAGDRSQNVADSDSDRVEARLAGSDDGKEGLAEVINHRGYGRSGQGAGGELGKWKPEPAVGRVANGIPRRMDRLRGLGNAVVPQIPELIGRAILEHEATR